MTDSNMDSESDREKKSSDSFLRDKEVLINNGIEKDSEYPEEPAHLDYKYLKSYEGPLDR